MRQLDCVQFIATVYREVYPSDLPCVCVCVCVWLCVCVAPPE